MSMVFPCKACMARLWDLRDAAHTRVGRSGRGAWAKLSWLAADFFQTRSRLFRYVLTNLKSLWSGPGLALSDGRMRWAAAGGRGCALLKLMFGC